MGFGLYWQPVIVHSVHWQINFVHSSVRPERFLSLFINPPCSAATQRTIVKCLIAGKALTIGIGISPTPPLIFTRSKKSAKFGVVQNVTQL